MGVIAGANGADDLSFPDPPGSPRPAGGASGAAADPSSNETLADDAEAGIVFSPREKALVELLAAGHTDASAARRLGVSPRTVSYTLQSLMDRLAVENRFQLGLALGTLGAQDVGDGPGPEPASDRPPDSIGD